MTRYDDDDGTGRLPGTVHQQIQKARPTKKRLANNKKARPTKQKGQACATPIPVLYLF